MEEREAAGPMDPKTNDTVTALLNPRFESLGDVAMSMYQAAGHVLDQHERIAAVLKALEPFATFAETFVDDEGWTGPMRQERIIDWFGPSDFRRALQALHTPPPADAPGS